MHRNNANIIDIRQQNSGWTKFLAQWLFQHVILSSLKKHLKQHKLIYGNIFFS